MLSDAFVKMASSRREMARYFSEEQSTSLHLGHDDSLIYHVFRNDTNTYSRPRILNDSKYYVAVYDKESLQYQGEAKLPGAVLGSTTNGALIILKDEKEMIFQFVKVLLDE